MSAGNGARNMQIVNCDRIYRIECVLWWFTAERQVLARRLSAGGPRLALSAIVAAVAAADAAYL